ncbi:MAG: hypothetical protein EHM19_00770 [Candidatus Latescibacterota bacterium]|nr:MAG: hypothetical protein EHM19_00770 [Candidatus Latescibacterota bacterium]
MRRIHRFSRVLLLLFPLLLLGPQVPIAHEHPEEASADFHTQCPLCLAARQLDSIVLPEPMTLPLPAGQVRETPVQETIELLLTPTPVHSPRAPPSL